MKWFEIYNVDSGKTLVKSEAACRRLFGSNEWKEVKAGYLPNLVVCETQKPE